MFFVWKWGVCFDSRERGVCFIMRMKVLYHFALLQVKLEVMGKKAKNATYLSGNEAGKISKEIQKVEKRRIVKSTLCNERSSRSHCLVCLRF